MREAVCSLIKVKELENVASFAFVSSLSVCCLAAIEVETSVLVVAIEVDTSVNAPETDELT